MNAAASESYEVGPKHKLRIVVPAEARRDIAIGINDLLQVQFPDDPKALSLSSRVDDIVGNRIHIAWPTDRGIRVPLHEQQTLTISFVRDDAVYAFTGIIEQLWRAPLAQLSLLMVGSPQRIQRRQFFRVKSLLPVEFFGELPKANDDDPSPMIIAFKTHTFEISGSGLAIRHSSSIPSGTLLECRLILADENARLKILCKVVHSSRVGSPAQTSLHHIGMYFLSIREADRTRIVRHVFRVERGRGFAESGDREAPVSAVVTGGSEPVQAPAFPQIGEPNDKTGKGDPMAPLSA